MWGQIAEKIRAQCKAEQQPRSVTFLGFDGPPFLSTKPVQRTEAPVVLSYVRAVLGSPCAARDELDRAVRAADAAYHGELVELGRAHGVTVR